MAGLDPTFPPAPSAEITEYLLPEPGDLPHDIAIERSGTVRFNGHFTHAPELIGSVEAASGKVTTSEVPSHPTLGRGPGGPMPYEIRVGPAGRLWGSELIGNRIFAYAPKTGRFEVYDLPIPYSGPRRFDLDAKGIVWIPAYSANLLLRFDPESRRFTEIPLPLRDAVPYIVRADPRSGALWIGTSAADALLRYDPAAYGASPGIPARIARVQRH